MRSLKTNNGDVDYNPERDAEAFNNSKGDLDANLYDCKKCNNKGYVGIVKNGRMVTKECECMIVRRQRRYIKKSGLASTIKNMTMQTFEAKSNWQKQMKRKAKEYLESNAGVFFVGGQVGAGKTHICTAIAGKYLKAGNQTLYIKWRQETAWLRMNMNDQAYVNRIQELGKVPVLYIDDFLKTQSGKTPTESDIKIAFEVINERYQKNVRTIISSELTISNMMEMEESVASRIIEMAQNKYVIDISKDTNKNYRLGVKK